jgi:hypothetical protein
MKLLLLKFKFWVIRKFNDNYPGKAEVKWAIGEYKHTAGILSAMKKYSFGQDLQAIATEAKVTRERVRQMILKGVYSAHRTVSKK